MTYVFLAYTVVWLAVLGYTVMLSRRQARLEAELTLLQQAAERDR